jgi:N-acetylglucosaminyldiphosphoundecaprenol N-acetyl-beta-D-mannosaminyltransferase
MQSIKRINILGCPFDAISFLETAKKIKDVIFENNILRIVTANVDFVMKAKHDPIFAKELWDADLVVADGVPILWAAALLDVPLNGRVNGTDLVWKCAEISGQISCDIALIGAMPGVAQRAASKLKERWPKAKVHAIPTPYPLGDNNNRELVANIRTVNAKIVLVALGAPSQERWINSYLQECGANVGIGVGSSLDIICGDKPGAPQWMKINGFEWLHRLILEPKRLGKRYLIEDSPFLFHLLLEIFKSRIHPRRDIS